MPGVRPRYVVSALRFLFVDQLISNLHTSIILGISSLISKLGKIGFKNGGHCSHNGGHFGSYFQYGRQYTYTILKCSNAAITKKIDI